MTNKAPDFKIGDSVRLTKEKMNGQVIGEGKMNKFRRGNLKVYRVLTGKNTVKFVNADEIKLILSK